jgi:hypothetical protein
MSSARLLRYGWTTVVLVFLFTSVARAELRFDQPVQDAGEVRGGPTLTRRFEFTNAGPRTVVITETKPSCGCLKPRLSANHFGPGEKGWVELEINTLSQPAGPVAWQVRLTYDDGDKPTEAVVQVHGQLTKEVSADPAALTILTNQSIGGEIAVTDRRAAPFHVTSARGSRAALRVTVDAVQPDALAGRYVVRLTVAEDFPEGRHDEVVSIFTDDPAYAELKIPVTVVRRARERVTATPDVVTIVAASGQPLPSQLVLIRSEDETAVAIESAVADDPAVTCRWATGPGNMVTLRVLIDRGKMKDPKLNATLRVVVSEPVRQTVSIPVRCQSGRP